MVLLEGTVLIEHHRRGNHCNSPYVEHRNQRKGENRNAKSPYNEPAAGIWENRHRRRSQPPHQRHHIHGHTTKRKHEPSPNGEILGHFETREGTKSSQSRLTHPDIREKHTPGFVEVGSPILREKRDEYGEFLIERDWGMSSEQYEAWNCEEGIEKGLFLARYSSLRLLAAGAVMMSGQ